MRLLPSSAIYRLLDLSTTRPKFDRVALVAGPPSPVNPPLIGARALPATVPHVPVTESTRCTTLSFPPPMNRLFEGSIATSSGFHMPPEVFDPPSLKHRQGLPFRA